MKKTLIALMAAASCAMADTQVWDFSTSVTEGDYLFDAQTGLFTDNADFDGTVLSETKTDGQIQTNICFTLNLTEAQKVTGNTQLIKMDMTGTSSGDIGLRVTTTGLATTWNTGDDRQVVTYETLLNDSSVFTNADGDKCITLTFVQAYSDSMGVHVWSNTTKYITDGGLKSASNKALASIYVNGAYIEALQFVPGYVGDAIKDTNAAFNAVVVEKIGATTPSVPEPATATLSLLALAGLAARRRRK